MKRIWLLLLMILCLLSLSPMEVLAQGNGIIQGQVVNGTPDGGFTEGLEVVLWVFQGAREQDALTATTDAQGKFRFTGLEIEGDWTYVVGVTYQGVTYRSGPMSFEPGEAELSPTVTVYETTTSDDGIHIQRAHMLLSLLDQRLSVTEFHIFLNPGDRTYIGEDIGMARRATSQFLLPQGSYDLALDDGSLGGRFLPMEGGFVDTEPLWPGTTTVLFRYTVDCPGGNCSLVKDMTHPTSSLNVLIADTGVEIETDRLTFEGKVKAEGQYYLNYVGRNLIAGDRLDLHLRLPQAEPAASPRSNLLALPWIILGAVVTILVLGYPFWREHVRASAHDHT